MNKLRQADVELGCGKPVAEVCRLLEECLSLDVARRLTSDDVLERLAWLMATRGVPDPIRSDNGPGSEVPAIEMTRQPV